MTTNLRPGYVRKNGAPYSAMTVVTEFYDLNSAPNGDNWMTVTTKVEERYLPAEARGPELDELLWFEGRIAVVIEPERWLAWDQGKG